MCLTRLKVEVRFAAAGSSVFVCARAVRVLRENSVGEGEHT